MLTAKRTGLSVIVRICAISAFALDGREWVSTTRTASSSTTTAALQLIGDLGVARAA